MEYNHTILLVEDDADDAEMTQYILGKLKGIKFTHIDDGLKALEFLFDPTIAKPSLILLDVKMPRVDGIDILGRLQGDAQLKRIPVLAFISSKEGRKYVESFGVKPDGYLTKPVDCKSFLTALAEIGMSQMVLNPRADISI